MFLNYYFNDDTKVWVGVCDRLTQKKEIMKQITD